MKEFTERGSGSSELSGRLENHENMVRDREVRPHPRDKALDDADMRMQPKRSLLVCVTRSRFKVWKCLSLGHTPELTRIRDNIWSFKSSVVGTTIPPATKTHRMSDFPKHAERSPVAEWPKNEISSPGMTPLPTPALLFLSMCHHLSGYPVKI